MRLNRASLKTAVDALCVSDPDLAEVVSRYGYPPLWGRRPGFATLIRIILEQQVSLASARAMYRKLLRHLGEVTPKTIARLGVGGLRRLGFTRQKAAYCHRLSVMLVNGELNLGSIARSTPDATRAALLQIHGLGPWSADIYLLMALRRPDVWPHGDLALAEAVRRIKRMRSRPSSEQLRRMAERWAPWRSAAARVAWHYYLSSPG
jgi:DNA-3-methyladenine glycosylase II